MENYKKQFTKPEHQNWLKMSIALNITTRGLAPFACEICDDIRVKSLNIGIKHFFPDLCKNCSIVEVIPCDPNNNICNSGQCRFHKGRSFRPCLIVKCNDYRNTVTDLIRKGLDIEIICNSCRTAEIIPCNPRNKVCNSRRCRFHMDQHTRQIISSRPCPKFICDTLRDTIEQRHRFGSPSWRNTDARKWCVNAWEIAKCFMPPDGYADVDNEVDTDLFGIITVYINCVEFQQYFTDPYHQRNICSKVRYIGKCVLHAPGLNISDWDLKLWLSDLKTLFADPIFNKNNPLAQDAIDQLDMLERDEFFIQHSDIAEVLDIKNTFKELSSGLEKRASDISDVLDDIIAPVKHDATNRAIQDTRELIEWKHEETGTMTEFMKKDVGTMTEHRDAKSLADSMKSNLLEPNVNVETVAMTEFKKKDVGTMTQYRSRNICNDTSPAGSIKTDLSKPSVDIVKNAMADFHIYTVEEALAKEPDSIINLAVQVIKTEAVQSNTTHDNTMRSYFSCLVADKTGSVWLRVYQAHERNTFKSHTSIMLRGLLRKSCEHPMWCVSTTELIYLQPVDVPQKIIEAAMKTTQPMSPQIRFLDEAVTSQTPSIAVDKLLPRDVIHEVTDPIPDSPDPDLLADVDWSEDICNSIQIDHTSPADSLETVLSEPSVNFDIEARTIPDLMKKCIGTITENRDQLDDQNETDEPLAAINETLYTQTQLNELCSQDGRKSKTVSRACDVIVNHLKETFDNMLCSNNEVLDIYPAFKVGKENEIIFVVTLSKTTDISVLCNAVAYTLEIRVLHKFNNELKTLMDAVHEESHSISDECQRPIAVTIGNWAKPLLEAHKYLSVITASPLKSKRNKDSEILQSFVREPECCIVFCVHAKDFIYIKEDPLPAKLNGISTDVMEGAFVTFGRLSHESHDKLPMGCEIGRGESRDIGTLGGFIDHPEYGLCGITSGHMCLDHAEYEACVKNNGRLMLEQWPKGSRGRGMFQPAKLQNGDEVGHLVEALYQVGSHLESGFDVALFQIENKYPEDGNFPAEKINDNMRDVGYTFKGGNVCGLSRAAGKSLWKFGRTSGSTTGKANLKTPTAVQEASFNWKTHDKYHITLVNQFEVFPIDIGQNKIFANHGDSGALVFIDEDRDDLKCVGMVAGGLVGTSIAIISPISSILKHCNVTKFHSFYNTPRQNSEAIQSLERRLGERIETMHSQLDQRITRIDDNFKRLFIMLEQQSNCASNTSSHEKRPSTQEINKSSKK